MSSTRKRLIELLMHHEDTYMSGQVLSEKLSISRNAVWKHMNELKKDGYTIEAKAKLGYKIISYPNKVSENTISWGLNTNWLGNRILHRETVTSTQRIAHELALDGAQHGTIVIADEQTEGKGRIGKQWDSKSGKGIWMSMILRPNIPPYLAPQLTLLTATVVAEVIDKETSVTPQIKWPNDVLVDGKKIAGILTEMQAEQDQISYVIVGIGINVNQEKDEIPVNTNYEASSLFLETKQELNMVALLQRILQTFEDKYDRFLDRGFEEVKQQWESYGFRIHERLQVTIDKETWDGIFLGIAEDGALLMDRAGEIKRIYSGEIAWF